MNKQKKEKLKVRDNGGNIFIAPLRAIKLGFSNFWRNRFLSIATILVIAVIIFIFNVILAIQFISSQALQTLSERVDMVVYLRDDISFNDAKRLSDSLSAVSGVKTVKYTSKEEAMEIVAKTHPKTAAFLQKFDLRNPLPPSVSVITVTPEDQLKVQQFFEQSEYKNMVQNIVSEGSSNESVILSNVAKNLISISHFVRQIIFWMVLVFVLGGTLVIVNAIQLTIYTRRNEIHIMRLVGATPNFIRLPFIFEGILYGVFAVLISFLFLGILGGSIRLEESNLWEYYNNLEIGRLFIAELALTMVLATLSSFSAVQQYLKGKLTVN
jgi:cell division transport system permease protein